MVAILLRKQVGDVFIHAYKQIIDSFFHRLISYPIVTILCLSFDTFIKNFFNFFLFNHIPYCNEEKHFSCFPSQLHLIVINAKPSIDLHDKSHKLS